MCVRYRRTTAEEELARIYKIPVRDYLGSVVPGSPNIMVRRSNFPGQWPCLPESGSIAGARFRFDAWPRSGGPRLTAPLHLMGPRQAAGW
jgi:hypothetical protein